MRLIRRSIFPLCAAAWLAGWIMNEQPPPWLWLYFIPAPAIAAYGLLEWAARHRRVSRARNVLVLTLTGTALFKTVAVDSRWNRPSPAPEHALRVVHWNVAHANFGFVPLLETLAAYRPDLVILSEARYSQDVPFFSNRELGLPHTHQEKGMILLSRHPFTKRENIPIMNGEAWGARVFTPAGELDVICADIVSHPLLDRSLSLEPLGRWIKERNDATPLLLIGDFNTPRDARAFRAIREEMRHAYEVAGRGWPYTWPLPIPLYAIDHAWVTPDITVHRYRLRNAPLSDHRRQIFEISLPSAEPPPRS